MAKIVIFSKTAGNDAKNPQPKPLPRLRISFLPMLYCLLLPTNHKPVIHFKDVAVRRTFGDHWIIAVRHETGYKTHDVLFHFRRKMVFAVNVMIMNTCGIDNQLGAFDFYPITTSKTIIKTNPMAKPMVLRLECSPNEASGINSSTTT